jgi:hypothetical protein
VVDSRTQVVAGVGEWRMKDAEAGLAWVATHDPSVALRLSAAEGLVRIRSDAAAAPLKELLASGDARQRTRVAGLLVDSNKLTDVEIADAIQAWADTRPESPEIVLPRSIGEAYSRAGAIERDAAAKLVLARADALEKTNPAAAARMRSILWKWPVPAVDAAIAQRLASGAFDPEMVYAAIDRREVLRRRIGTELEAVAKEKTPAGGIAVLLLGNRAEEVQVLESTNAEAKRGLLAAARLASESLPVDDVAALMNGRHPKLAIAAEKYLEEEDSRVAREALMARHPGEVRIYGWRSVGEQAKVSLDKWEEALRTSVRKGEWDEIYGLATTGLDGKEDQQILVKSRADKAVLINNGQERPITAEQVAALHNFLATRAMDDAPPLNYSRGHGLVMEYLHLTKAGGRRVFMNDPMSASLGAAEYLEIVRKFEGL